VAEESEGITFGSLGPLGGGDEVQGGGVEVREGLASADLWADASGERLLGRSVGNRPARETILWFPVGGGIHTKSAKSESRRKGQ